MEFINSLVSEEEYQLGLEIKYTKIRSQENKESIKIWTKIVSQFHPFTFHQIFKAKSYEKLVPHIRVFVHILYVNKNVLEILICRWLHWKYAYT